MAFVSLTRLHLRSLRFFPAFLWHTLASTRQIKRAPGFLAGRLGSDSSLAFWTVTVWRDQAAMNAYRTSGPHQRAMPKLIGWCDEASIANWTQETPDVPGWTEAHRRMASEGRRSKVRYPSPAHEAFHIPPLKVPDTVGQQLRPA